MTKIEKMETLTRLVREIRKIETLTRYGITRIGSDYEILGEYVAENIWHYKKP